MQQPEINIPADVDAYLALLPPHAREPAEQVRAAIRAAAPAAREVISYRMPAYKMNGILVWFAAHKSHIGFYPGATGIEAFKSELEPCKLAKGSVQFPFEQSMPLELIGKIVRFRVQQQMQNTKTGKK